MPDPKPDRSAMGLLKRVRHECWKFAIGSTAMALGDWIEKELPTTERHARNVDKQRRRLLAADVDRRASRCERSADYFASRSVAACSDRDHRLGDLLHKRSVWCESHASKLRTIAARLRGTE